MEMRVHSSMKELDLAKNEVGNLKDQMTKMAADAKKSSEAYLLLTEEKRKIVTELREA
ncbi:hypothetical protein U1Q18_008998, partial [Sarracenia purpurea var. burkii]